MKRPADTTKTLAQTDAAVEAAPRALVTEAVLAGILAAVQAPVIPTAYWSGWLAGMVLICGARAAVHIGLARSRRRARDPHWQNGLAGLNAFAGATWGAAALLFLSPISLIPDNPHPTIVRDCITLSLIAGVLATNLPTVAAVPRAYPLFAGMTLIPAATAFAIQPYMLAKLMAALLIAGLIAMIRAARHHRATVIDARRARYRNQALMDRLKREDNRAELFNRELKRSDDELRRIRDSLKSRVEERTAELSSTVERLENEMAERKAAQAKLVEQTSRFQALFDQAPEAMVLVDTDRRIGMANAALTEVFEYSVDEIIGRQTDILYHRKSDWEDSGREYFNPESLKSSRPYVVTMQRKSGAVFPCEVIRSVLHGPDGEVTGFIGSMRDISERQRTEARVQFLAHHDSLTSLPNRALFLDRLNMALAQALRDDSLVAILLLDLDDFKHVNDTLGHQTGDALLQEIAKRLRKCARESDTVARLGGDEFAIIQARVGSMTESGLFAQRLLEALSAPVMIEDQVLHVSASIGVTIFPTDADNSQGLLKNADLAMYRAKAEGRGGFAFYSLEMGSQAQERMLLAAGLRRALAENQFVLHYQPKVDAGSGRLLGCEALLRWMHPEKGLMSPGAFIPVAESTGLILPIGAWVLEEGCRQMRAWLDQGFDPVPLSVNLSATQFRDPRLVERVREALESSRVAPEMLELEITETALMHNTEAAISVLTDLTQLGVHLSIDDFGTGYSSLNYLKRFPVGRLKIDQSFVHGIVESSEDAAIARAVTELGHSLGLSVLAEGVETEAQSDALKALGCDEIQGFLTGRPIAPKAFGAILASSGERGGA